ncbi:MAG: lytic transglycosylase domain-containing protein [Acidimicrobiia bacterium]|nr:lytic transglycosylase domain-containing protein [Acidimicrobiia bacterium]
MVAESGAVDIAHDERQATRQRVVEVTQARDRAALDRLRLTSDVGTRLFELDQVRATSRVTGTDFTLVALDAFVRAAGARAGDCAVPWWGLAGISRVEGRHGTYGGGSLLPDGQVSRSIIGIALTGEAGTAAIGDTDGGALDGDGVYDRAVGPMQFIPSTWARFGTDGDLDGDIDPQNMYDAVAAAADYLCHNRVVRTETDLRAGYFSYNHSQVYVETVFGYAVNYAAFRIPPPPPAPPVPATYPPQA